MGDGDSDNELEEQGPCGKLASSLGMMCIGMAAFVLSLLALAWNENHYACNNARVLFAEAKAVDAGCDSTKVMDKFAFFSCPVIESSLQVYSPCSFNRGMSCTDQPPINFSAPSGKQVVEMYQCVEKSCDKQKDVENGKEVLKCEYRMEWSQQTVGSYGWQFGSDELRSGCPDFDDTLGAARANPSFPNNLQPGEAVDYAQTLLVGANANKSYVLGHGLLQELTPDTLVDLSDFAGDLSGSVTTDDSSPWTRPLVVKASSLRVNGNYLDTCIPPYRLGCVRIQYFASVATSPSVMTHVGYAGATAAEVIPSSWGCKPAPWQKILPDSVTKEEMIAGLRLESNTEVWLIRIGGCLATILAVFCCLRPLAAAADVLGDCIGMCPCGGMLEAALEGMVDAILCAISCNVGCACSLLAIAAVWFYMRPMYSAALLAVAVCCICGAVGARHALDGGEGQNRDLEEEWDGEEPYSKDME